jgi:hypothetical protein
VKVAELQEEVAVELALLEATVSEAVALMRDVGLGEATVRERTAAAAFLAQFYGGVENILKRLCRFHGVALPVGETWHVDLLRYFSPPPVDALPMLFEGPIAVAFTGYRKFRHVVHHGYGFHLDWSRVREGIEGLETASLAFRQRLDEHLSRLQAGLPGRAS